jgi:hypothetical protein
MNLLPSDVESFPEDIKAGFCRGTLAGDEDIFFYHEGIKARFAEFLKGKMGNIPSALFEASNTTVSTTGSVIAINDNYWLSLTTKEEIEKMAGSPPPQLNPKDMLNGDWIVLRCPLDDRLVAQLRSAAQDTDNKMFRKGVVGNSYLVTADMEAVTRLNLLLYYVQIEMERAGKEPELLDTFSKKVVYEFSTYAYDILQKREDEKNAWISDIINWGAYAIIFGVVVTWLSGRVMGRGKMPDPFDPKGPNYRKLVEDIAERLRTESRPAERPGPSPLDGDDAKKPFSENVIDMAERLKASGRDAKTSELLGRVKKAVAFPRDALRRAREK